ncbi:MAG: hypothetical protein OXD54_14845 [Candidatus Poribacteria bacterium]|nr:hypothetical protein [Candidatus Poribacteria bacterium]
MPKCYRSEAHVIDYVYGELDPNMLPDFENHLTTCNQCTRKVFAYKHVLNLVDEAEEEFIPQPIAPYDLETKLYKRLAEVPPEKSSFYTQLLNNFDKVLLVFKEQKIASICTFAFAVIAIAFFVGNPFRPTPTYDVTPNTAADERIEQYRQQGIQRSLEDILRNKHLRYSDGWDTVSQLNRVKDQAKGTDWANVANKQLKRVQQTSDL